MLSSKNRPNGPNGLETSGGTFRLDFKQGETIGFSSMYTPGPWSFLFESTYRAWAESLAKIIFNLLKDTLPDSFRDPKRVGVLSCYSDMGMEGYCKIIVEKFDCYENNPYDLRTVLFPDTEIVIFSPDGQTKFEGKVEEVIDRLTSTEFRFCFFWLKMEKHGLFGYPPKEDR